MIHQLPSAPSHKTRWPWSVDPKQLPDYAKGTFAFPKITLVTPSLNQGRFIEETIRSVLLQDYPNLEYIVIDGGSSDETVEILEKYQQWLTYWISEPDQGQSHAIEKGFSLATGDIVNWLNSDDVLLPGSLFALAEAISQDPDAIAWVGSCEIWDEQGEVLLTVQPKLGDSAALADWNHKGVLCQPACFYRLSDYRKVGGVNRELYYAMDVELWVKLAGLGHFSQHSTAIAVSRIYPGIKSLQDLDAREVEYIVIAWTQGYKEVARNKLIRYIGQRAKTLFFEMSIREFMFTVLRWIWRKLKSWYLTIKH